MTLNKEQREYLMSKLMHSLRKAEKAEQMTRLHFDKGREDLSLLSQVDAELWEAQAERAKEMLISNELYK